MPIAYRTGKDLRVRHGIKNNHFNLITAGHSYVTFDPEPFDFNLKHLFKKTIYNLAEDFTKEKFNVEQEEKNQPIYIGELDA